MAMREAPCGWVPDFTGCSSGPCCPDVDAPENAAFKALAGNLASSILWALTGRRFGCCEITVRPCKPLTCDPISLVDVIYWDSTRGAGPGFGNNMGVMSYFPTLVGGEVFNIACGCPIGCCKCRSSCEVRLPGPVCEISAVQVGAVVLTAADYQAYNHDILVFYGDTCPPCQNYDLPLGAEGTWSVTYTIGEPVPIELAWAAGQFACELAKSMAGDKSCGLPTRVQNIARQGVDIALFDPTEFANQGLTGIPLVDLIIRELNPYRMAQASYVWSPDLPKIRRETG